MTSRRGFLGKILGGAAAIAAAPALARTVGITSREPESIFTLTGNPERPWVLTRNGHGIAGPVRVTLQIGPGMRPMAWVDGKSATVVDNRRRPSIPRCGAIFPDIERNLLERHDHFAFTVTIQWVTRVPVRHSVKQEG